MSKTIATIATPIGEGGIGVIQVTGPSALKIVNKIFRSNNIKNLERSENNRLYYGTIHDEDNNQIDEAIINVYRKSVRRKSEDLVEINCHGGIYLVKKILDLIAACGAHKADWQEFASRLVGLQIDQWPNLDSIQDEAIQELPNTITKLGAKVILDQYVGALSSSITNLIKQIEDIEDIHDQKYIDVNLPEYVSKISSISSDLEKILDTFSFGKAITRPENIVIIGKPNVGKSTLINRLLGKDRVIVHHQPGTTRDPISELICIKGIPFNLFDTAGVRDTKHIIEKKGIEITNELILKTDKLILMFDSSAPLEKDDIDIFNLVCSRLKIADSMGYRSNKNGKSPTIHKRKTKLIPVLSKMDLPAIINRDQIKDLFQPVQNHLNETDMINISAINGIGISELEDRIVSEFKKYINYKPGAPIIFRDRQFKLLFEACKKLDKIDCIISGNDEIGTWPNLLKESKHMIFNCLNN